jgi:hypothetical protein
MLNIGEVDGLRSMACLPPDERQLLLNERSRSIEAVCVRIRALLEKIDRSDTLLKDYEMDLAKLRQAEFLLDKKNEQLDTIEVNALTKEDEVEYLRQSLKNTKAELQNEKMINATIKQNRVRTKLI